MKYGPLKHYRQSMRQYAHDYTMSGGYFVTICTHEQECLFGEVVRQEMQLSDIGEIARKCWVEMPKHFETVKLDKFIVMPNHFHGILVLHNVRTRHALSLPRTEQFGKPIRGSVPTIIRSFKSPPRNASTNCEAHQELRFGKDGFTTTSSAMTTICTESGEYIEANPMNWACDEENPNKRGPM